MQIFVTWVVVGAVSVGWCAAFTHGEPVISTDSIHSSTTRFAVQRAVAGALRRLDRPECGAVLSDFRDAEGRTIREKLDLLSETPRSYLTRLTFREVIGHRCQDATTAAFTRIGSREVFICGSQFWTEYRINPPYIEAVIIHEMMHTLGLPENPPSSLEINTAVLRRCWQKGR